MFRWGSGPSVSRSRYHSVNAKTTAGGLDIDSRSIARYPGSDAPRFASRLPTLISRGDYPIPAMRGQETGPHTDAQEGAIAKRSLWSDFSFVASSRYREEVVLSLAAGPKLP